MPSDSLSVLVVDEDPGILSFFAKMLDTYGIRALLARDPREALGIAKRGYVPIDVVVTDVNLRTEMAGPELTSGHNLVDQVRELRPDVRALYMSACLDAGVIQIEMVDRGFKTSSTDPDERGLIESIRGAASAPLAHRAGVSSHH
ncbi:MAG: response regulator [Acidobacteriota bacterium]|nr:response regulator [Acidobacteriota bacterium]